jgi:16S rRNA (guanine(527)-N(7))-methyltransferase RsmG
MKAGEEVELDQLERLFGVHLSGEQKRQVGVYLEALSRWGRRLNLTSIDQVGDQLRLHFWEAFWAVEQFLGPATTVADVGSGAGFPGLAMKLYRPALGVTLIEPNFKKAVFLKETARRLGLEVACFVGRAEAFQGWEEVETATLRGLRLSEELSGRLGRAGVRLLLFHGAAREGPRFGWRTLRREAVPGSERRFVSWLERAG